MTEQLVLLVSPAQERAAAIDAAHRAGRIYIAPTVTLPYCQGTVPEFHRARATDPRSSHEAAKEVTATGRAESECAQVLAALRDHPHTTSKELAERSGLDYHLVARRLPELRDTYHQVTNGTSRICRATGSSRRREVMTWDPVNPYHPNGGNSSLHHPPANASAPNAEWDS